CRIRLMAASASAVARCERDDVLSERACSARPANDRMLGEAVCMNHPRGASHEAMLAAHVLGEPRYRLFEDQALEVLGLGMRGECRLVTEHLVEEELRRLGERLVDLEGQHAGLGLGLRQELLD